MNSLWVLTLCDIKLYSFINLLFCSYGSKTFSSYFHLSASAPILFPGKKYPNGQFFPFVDKSSLQDGYPTNADPIEIPEFLKTKDYTADSSAPTCVGIYIDVDDLNNVTLQTIDCTSKVFAFCEIISKSNELESSRGLPTVPCVQPNSRKKRQSNTNEGNNKLFHLLLSLRKMIILTCS